VPSLREPLPGAAQPKSNVRKSLDTTPQAYLRDVLARIVARHPMGRIDELRPFAYVPAADKAAAWQHRLLYIPHGFVTKSLF